MKIEIKPNGSVWIVAESATDEAKIEKAQKELSLHGINHSRPSGIPSIALRPE